MAKLIAYIKLQVQSLMFNFFQVNKKFNILYLKHETQNLISIVKFKTQNPNLNLKLKAATIIESIVAMTLIMISFGIAMMIFVNINKSNNNFQKFRAKLIINEMAEKTINENNYTNEVIKGKNIKVTRTISSYKSYTDLKLLLIEAHNSEGKKIAERKELIFVE